MTQKEKLRRADMLAMKIKSIARNLERDAKDYDCQFPLEHAKELKDAADWYLNTK